MHWLHESLRLDIATRDEISQTNNFFFSEEYILSKWIKKRAVEIAWKKLGLGCNCKTSGGEEKKAMDKKNVWLIQNVNMYKWWDKIIFSFYSLFHYGSISY